jgi:hypothetical protein
MRRFLRLLTAAFAGALGLGCSDQQQAPTAPADPPAPSLSALRFRPAAAFFIIGADANTSLVVQAGWEPGITAVDLCADFTGGIQDAGQKGQIVFTPPGGAHLQVSATDANIVVYQFGGGLVTDICQQLVGAPIIGTGTGQFTDLLQSAGPGGTIFHITVKGIIDLTAGGQARLFGTSRITILADGTQLFDEERISLTPL